MADLDWICLAVLALSLSIGAWRGLVYEVLSVVNWVLAFVLAQWSVYFPREEEVVGSNKASITG